MKAKILIAEDDAIQGLNIWHTFKLWGYEMCEYVLSAEEAIIKAKQEKPDIVLIDIKLNGKNNGIIAARHIHSHLGIPIIFITGYSEKKIRDKAKIAEPVGYFIKPLDLYKVRLTIDSVTRKDK